MFRSQNQVVLWKLWSGKFQSPVRLKYESRFKLAVSATVILLPKMDYSRVFSIQGFLAMRLQALSTKREKMLPSGSQDNGWQWAGTVAIADIETPAAVGIL